MGRADAAVTLILIYVQSAFGEDFPEEPINCNRYVDFAKGEWFCRPVGLFDISEDVMNDGVFTREELLEEVSVRCSNVTLFETYFDCLEELVAECPEQYMPVLGPVNKKIQMFCDGTEVSTWLLTMLENGYSIEEECFSVSKDLLMECGEELKFDSNMSVTTALEILPQTVSALFQCTKKKFTVIPTSYQECGSSWTDVLLSTWLLFTALSTGSYLSDDDMMQLQALKTGQSYGR
ncbi:uncharacterized protein LOC123534280 [Mercenaria mercenaria]|uniref:uncharacterized protein LOC123534280 n=1 Tax=Mercenaria mercenaria TaxID=6596 RepID=UPI00234F3361|nr:uncharacterized protein LOC123534280 [Mercenaria mercenaria]